MILHKLAAHVALCTCAFLVCTDTITGDCVRKMFIRLPPYTANHGQTIAVYDGVTEAKCERTCRLYAECGGYVIRASATSGLSQCRLFDGAMSVSYTHSADTSLFGRCPDEMTDIPNGACHKVFEEPKRRKVAKLLCERLSQWAHLVDINTVEEFTAVTNMAAKYTLTAFWTAGRRQLTTGMFEWENSGKDVEPQIVAFSDAAANQQVGSTVTENWLEIRRSADGSWRGHAENMEASASFICKI